MTHNRAGFISRLTVRWMRYKSLQHLRHMIEFLTVVMRSSVYKGVDRASAEPCFINSKLWIGQTCPPQSRKPRLSKASSTPNRVGTVDWYYQGHQDRELLPVSTQKACGWICKPGVFSCDQYFPTLFLRHNYLLLSYPSPSDFRSRTTLEGIVQRCRNKRHRGLAWASRSLCSEDLVMRRSRMVSRFITTL